MKNMKKGFTLIELLIVVLIIGILSAIALPQYQLAVLKSRLSEAFILSKAIKEAQKRHKLATGNYTLNIDDLDIELPCSLVQMDTENNRSILKCPHSTIAVYKDFVSPHLIVNNDIWINIYYERGSDTCNARNSPVGEKLCQNMGAVYLKTDGDIKRYTL